MPKELARVKPAETVFGHNVWRRMIKPMPDGTPQPYSDIAERIRWHRALEGLDQAAYAKRAGLNRSQLSNWETGTFRLSLDGARALRRTYGLSLDFLFEGEVGALPFTLRQAWLRDHNQSAS